jgi:hypothetical protein
VSLKRQDLRDDSHAACVVGGEMKRKKMLQRMKMSSDFFIAKNKVLTK